MVFRSEGKHPVISYLLKSLQQANEMSSGLVNVTVVLRFESVESCQFYLLKISVLLHLIPQHEGKLSDII
jgi:hypothetical protein